MILTFLLLTVVLCACKREPDGPDPNNNESMEFAFCNGQLSPCIEGAGSFCLFGFKWGTRPQFEPTGYSAVGPMEPGGTISYSFQEENGLINTHRQINLPSKSFEEIIPCAKEEIRRALNAWAGIADLDFEEMPENSDSDVRFFVADIIQSGIGYPNYNDQLCTELSGNVVIKSNVRFNECGSFYLFMLHEIGHVLGLGHVSSANIMSPNFFDFGLETLQAGDSIGIQQIYGPK